jgi:hypothetical protein
MRDPKRIPRVAERLAELWRAYPDMRLNQLISTVNARISVIRDPFYTEDDEFERAIDLLIEERGRVGQS